MYPKDIIEPALHGDIHIEFVEIVLTRKGVATDVVHGNGYVRQDRHRFEFVFFPKDKKLPEPYFFMRHLMQQGPIIKDDAFFIAECQAMDGRRWRIEDILPDPRHGSPGYVVHARVGKLQWVEEMRHDQPLHAVACYILGSHNFSPNDIRKIEQSTGSDPTPSASWSFTIARVTSVPDLKIVVEKMETYTTLSVSSEARIPDNAPLAALQAFEFMLGKQLCCVAIVMAEGNELTGILEPRVDPATLPHCHPPVEPFRPDNFQPYWDLFARVMQYLMRQDAAAHTLATAVSEVIAVGNALLGIQATIRCIAVESVCGLISAGTATSTAAEQEVLVQHLDAGAYSPRFNERIKRMLGMMDKPAVKNTLYELKTKGAIQQDHIKSWSKLRNTRVHGSAVSAAEVETVVKRMNVVVGLFYRLVFYLVGYSGPAIDYLAPQKAPIQTIKKSELEAGQLPPIKV